MNTRIRFFWMFMFFSSISFGQTVERVEPPNWWIDMKNPLVQIMLYGKDIGKLKPEIKYKGVKLIQYECPENPNYLFIDLALGSNCKAGTIPIELKTDKHLVATVSYPLMEREHNSSDRQGYTPSDAMYLITPDRFVNGEGSNDNPEEMKEKTDRTDKNGRHGGDLEGIRQHLDYIADMGFTAVWINPLLENNMSHTSYHGYAITDFYKLDPRMGTNSSYQLFCREAHQKGIKVIMDMVLNHCGSEHWWMQDPPTRDWINYYQQNYTQTNHRKTLQQDPYAAQEDLIILEDGWFTHTMPDLNVTNAWLATYLTQNTIWWIEFAGLSGIRMDTYLYPEHQFMANWSRAVMTEYPHFNITGEVWYDQPAILAYWQRGKTNPDEYTSGLPSLFDFPQQMALSKALNTEDHQDGGWTYLYETLALDFVYPEPLNMVVFADNHDMSRIYAQVDENKEKVKLALAYVLTSRGIPEIYYGTEILMTSPKTRDDGVVRSDFPGGWTGDRVNAFTGEGLNQHQKEMQTFVKKVLNWRKNATAIHQGMTVHFVPEHGIYVYFRYDDQQKIMIVLNKNDKPVTLNLERFKNMIGEVISGTEIISGKDISLKQEIILDHAGPLIIACKNE